MITVNSLSGGKTSSYLAAHYPADLDVFSLVCIDDHNANAGRIDKVMVQRVNDRLQKYCADQHEFMATAEDPKILKLMFDLEQHIGREIIWLRGIGFQDLIAAKAMVPNKKHRFCTTMMKIDPIFNFLFRYHELPVKMRIGFRFDEEDRVEKFKDTYIMETHCEMHIDDDGVFLQKKNAILTYPVVTSKGYSYATRRKEVPFRIGEFPLVDNYVFHWMIQKYWDAYLLKFPEDSNCQNCPWKHPLQLKENFITNAPIMHSASIMESVTGGTFHSDFSLIDIQKLQAQTDLFQMRGGSCSGGYCTS